MKKFNLIVGKIVDREELKNIKGGSSLSGPDSPSGGGSGGSYKCCWTATPTVCSTCVPCTSSCTCVTNATLTAC